MMTTIAIRQRLYDDIRTAEDKKVKAIYTMLEAEIEHNYDYWHDPDFLTELERRSQRMKQAEPAGIPWEEARQQILSAKKTAGK